MKNTGNGIKDNGDGTATIKCGAVKIAIRYEGKKKEGTGCGKIAQTMMTAGR